MTIDLQTVTAALTDLYTPAEAAIWLDAPQRLLNGRTPRDEIARGHGDAVMRVIKRLTEGVYS